MHDADPASIEVASAISATGLTATIIDGNDGIDNDEICSIFNNDGRINMNGNIIQLVFTGYWLIKEFAP